MKPDAALNKDCRFMHKAKLLIGIILAALMLVNNFTQPDLVFAAVNCAQNSLTASNVLILPEIDRSNPSQISFQVLPADYYNQTIFLRFIRADDLSNTEYLFPVSINDIGDNLVLNNQSITAIFPSLPSGDFLVDVLGGPIISGGVTSYPSCYSVPGLVNITGQFSCLNLGQICVPDQPLAVCGNIPNAFCDRSESPAIVKVPPSSSGVISCEFTTNSAGKIVLCVGGFATEAELLNAKYDMTASVVANQLVYQPKSNLPNFIALGPDGYFTCFAGDFTDELVDQYIESYIEPSNTACSIAKTLGVNFTVSLAAATGAEACTITNNDPSENMNLTSYIEVNGLNICTATKRINFQTINEIIEDDEEVITYEICSQIPEDVQKEDCCECATGSRNLIVDAEFASFTNKRKICAERPDAASFTPGIWTAVGCIKAQPQDIVAQLVQIGLGVAGGIALLMMLAAAFLFSTSQGDPKRTNQARDLLTSAVIGLLFIIFSVTILQFIGVTILRIPDFGI